MKRLSYLKSAALGGACAAALASGAVADEFNIPSGDLKAALNIYAKQAGVALIYVKNVFDATAITGAFLNSDDTALTTNVFLTDPRLFGLRITKSL